MRGTQPALGGDPLHRAVVAQSVCEAGASAETLRCRVGSGNTPVTPKCAGLMPRSMGWWGVAIVFTCSQFGFCCPMRRTFTLSFSDLDTSTSWRVRRPVLRCGGCCAGPAAGRSVSHFRRCRRCNASVSVSRCISAQQMLRGRYLGGIFHLQSGRRYAQPSGGTSSSSVCRHIQPAGMRMLQIFGRLSDERWY